MARPGKHLRGEVKPSKFKTTICQFFAKNAECPFGDKCAFAHGEAELRSEDQNLETLETPEKVSATAAETPLGSPVVAVPLSKNSTTTTVGTCHVVETTSITQVLAVSTTSSNGASTNAAARLDGSASSDREGTQLRFRHNPYGLLSGRTSRDSSLTQAAS